MKKYISPIAKSISLEGENMIAVSGGVSATRYNGDVMSNERETTSSNIWGED